MIPKDQEDIDSYVKRAEQAIARVNHEWESAYSFAEKKHFLKNNRGIDYSFLNTADGRVAFADFIVEYLSGRLEDYLGFKIESDEERSIAFRDILGASNLEIKLYLANNGKALSQGHVRDTWVKSKKDSLQKIFSRILIGAGLRIDKSTGKAYSITDRSKRDNAGDYDSFDDQFEDDIARLKSRVPATSNIGGFSF